MSSLTENRTEYSTQTLIVILKLKKTILKACFNTLSKTFFWSSVNYLIPERVLGSEFIIDNPEKALRVKERGCNTCS